MIEPYKKCLKKIPASIEELQRLTDELYEQIGAETRQARAEKGRVVKVIDMVLKLKGAEMFSQLKRIVSGDLFQSIQRYDDEFLTFERVLSIYEEEKSAGKTSLLDWVTSVAELQEIYAKTFFGMRRLELDMPKESKEEFLQLIVQYDMSAIYLTNMWNWHPFYNPGYLVQQLMLLLSENGKEALCEEIYGRIEEMDK